MCVLLLATMAPSCKVLGPPGTFKAAAVVDVTEIVAERTSAYVQEDETLEDTEQAQRLLAIDGMVGLLESSNDVSLAAFREVSEGPLGWHDTYVAADARLPPHKKERYLRSTSIIRDDYWPRE